MTDKFKQTLNSFEKHVIAKVTYDDKEIITEIKKAELTKNTEIGNCIINELKLTIKNYGGIYDDIINKTISFYLGFKYDDATTEFYHIKDWIVIEINNKLEKNNIEVIARDFMEKFNIPYKNIFSFPLTVKEYLTTICNYVGIGLELTSFPNEDYEIQSEPFLQERSTFKDAISQICGATLSIPMITDDNKLKLKWFEQTEHLIKDFSKITEGVKKTYDSVVLGRGDIEDNIFYPNNVENLDNSFRIDNNYILYFDRENMIIPLYERIENFEYVPVEIETKDCDFTIESGDIVNYNVVGGTNNTPITRIKIIYNGGLELQVSSPEVLDKKTDIKKAGNLTKKIINTEIAVDKQNKKIESTISEITEIDDKVNENYSKTTQDILNLTNSFQNTNGSNLIKNSVMFSYDNNRLPTDWELEGKGTITINPSSESLTAGGISGNVFSLYDLKVKQRISVKKNISDKKAYYSFNCKIKKEAVGKGYIKIFNDNEEHLIELLPGQATFYGDYELLKLSPTMSYYDIEIYGTDGITFTDVMFSLGEYKQTWSQANGEVMNSNVQFSLNGIKVFNSVGFKDYTVMSPLEFSGYSDVNGQLKKVFTLNKDTTEVSKMKSKEEISMSPIKIVPINNGNIKGWAFVSDE